MIACPMRAHNIDPAETMNVLDDILSIGSAYKILKILYYKAKLA